MNPDDCPDPRLLDELLAATLDARVEATLLEHLDGCSSCRQRMSSQPGGTEWLGASRRARASESPPNGTGKNAEPIGQGQPARSGPVPFLRPGRLGDFEILREVGRGGMGIVYEARQKSLDRRVAIKILPNLGALDPELVERFQREARTAASLHHTNIVPVHGAGEEDGLHFFAMEFIEGRGLDCMIPELRARHESGDRGARLRAYREGVEWALQAADALAYAHAHGVVHRDIKPSNLLLDGSSTVWVTDFGLARADDSAEITQRGDVLGTLGYIAPERLRGVSDPRCDIYGLGISLYELLTLRPAFRDSDRPRLLRRIAEEEPPAPRAVEPLIPRDLETIVLAAIEKDPARRYQDASSLAEDLRRFLIDRPIHARRTTRLERGWRWCRRNRATAALLALVGLVSMVALFTGWHSWRAHEARRTADLRSRSDQAFWDAQRLHGEGSYDEALSRVRDALALSNSQEARLLHARLLHDLEDSEASARVLRSLLAENRNDGAAHYLLASIYRDRDPARSEFHRREAERLLEGSAEAFHLRALAAPSVRVARDWLDRGLDIDPTHYPSLRSRSLACFSLGDHDGMSRDAFAAVSHRPADARNWALLAIAEARRGSTLEAARHLDRALALQPGRIEFLEQRREVLRRLGESARELADARHVVSLAPDDPSAAFHLVAALVHAGLIAEAKDGFARATGASWSVSGWWSGALTRRVFLDAAAGLRLALPDRDGHELIERMHAARRVRECLRSRFRLLAGNAYKASWSPDGRQLVYDSVLLHPPNLESPSYPGRILRRSLRILEIESGRDVVLVEDGKDAAWSPDGTRIAFVRDVGRKQADEEVWIVAADGGEPRRVVRGGFPTWSSDPRRLFFHSRGRGMLCDIDLDDPDARVRGLCPTTYPYPAVSPDGSRFARSVSVEEDGLAAVVLEVVDIASREVEHRFRVPLAGRTVLAEWSPDGDELSVGCASHEDLGLWVLDLRTDAARLVVDGPVTLGTWSRDRHRFAVTVRGSVLEIWGGELDASGSTARSLAPVASVEEHLAAREREARDAIVRGPGSSSQFRRLARVLEEAGRPGDAGSAYLGAYRASVSPRSEDLASAARLFERAGDLEATVRALEEAARSPNRSTAELDPWRRLRRRSSLPLPSYESIDARLLGTEVLIAPRAEWRSFRGDVDPGEGWMRPGFDDTSWSPINLRDGPGAGDPVARLLRTQGRSSTVFLRREFRLRSIERFETISLGVLAKDGFVAFLNGVEIARWRAGPNGRIVRHDDVATLAAPGPLDRRVVTLPRELLRRGDNLVALVVLSADESGDPSVRCILRGEGRTPESREAFAGLDIEFVDGSIDPSVRLRREYLLARRDSRRGELSRALSRFRELIAADPEAELPRLRAAETLYLLGEHGAACEVLRAALESPFAQRRELRELWWTATLEGATSTPIPLEEIPGSDREGPGAIWRESLTALRSGGVLRINCGGGSWQSTNGDRWLSDRFFTSGFLSHGEEPLADAEPYGAPAPYRGTISGTAQDEIYRTERWFSLRHENHRFGIGYRIPVSNGTHGVTLHFAEIESRRPGSCIFGVRLEGSVAIERIEPLAEAGFAHALTRTHEVNVRDGFLDLEFERSRGRPKISAIEITRRR